MWKQAYFHALLALSLGTLLVGCQADDDDDENRANPHRDPSLCEVCKYLTTEVKGRLDETGKTHEVIETGYGLDQKKKRKEYKKSELRLIEVINDPHVCDKILQYNIHAERKGSLRFAKGKSKTKRMVDDLIELRLIEVINDPHVCDKILQYNVHAERKGSLRFAKGRSQTMETLHGLVHKGVKVELGIPYEMWDTPSAGVTEMQRQCFMIVETYEEAIEDWYWNHQDKDFTEFLCRDRVLKEHDRKCLSEVWTGEEEKKDQKEGEKGDVEDKKPAKKSSKKNKKKLKGDVGSTENVVEEGERTLKDDVSTEEKKDEL